MGTLRHTARALLQLELERLLDQLKLAHAAPPTLGAAEPGAEHGKRKRSMM